MAAKITVSAASFLCWAAALLLLPARLVFAAAVAAAVHELFHYLALRLFRLRVHGVRITPLGAVMETEPMERGQEILCALAGPFGSLLLPLLAKRMPLLAFCGLVQGLFNLIPVYPLDGGRALRCLLPHRLYGVVETAFLAAVAILGIYFHAAELVFTWIGWTLLRKIPCKDARQRVQ